MIGRQEVRAVPTESADGAPVEFNRDIQIGVELARVCDVIGKGAALEGGRAPDEPIQSFQGCGVVLKTEFRKAGEPLNAGRCGS